MNKDQYLEQLYAQLQKYDADSVIKHVTEYDYLISDMLEEASFEEVIDKLGTSQALAQSIAEEFGYNLKNTNQFEEPIFSRKKNYGAQSNNSGLIKFINISFILLSIFFFSSYFLTLLGILIIIATFAIFSIPTMLWSLLALLTFSAFIISVYMLILNLKNLFVNRLLKKQSEVN